MTEPMRWRMFAYMAALFIAGAITGAAVMSRTAAGSQTLKVGRSEEIASLIRQKLTTRLELSREQREKCEPLIKKTSEEMEASHLECIRQVSTSLDNLHVQIGPELTPEQKEKLKQLDEEKSVLMRKKYNYPPQAVKAGNP